MPILVGIVQLLFANCFYILSYVHQQLHSLYCQNFVHHNSLVFLPLLEQGFIFEREPTIYKIVSENNLYRCEHIKVHLKTFHPFYPLLFLPLFVPHTEFKGSPDYVPWNVLYHTSLTNYASFSLQVPSILSIFLRSYPVEAPLPDSTKSIWLADLLL